MPRGLTASPNTACGAGDANAEWCAEFICWCVDRVDQRYGTNLLAWSIPTTAARTPGETGSSSGAASSTAKGNCPDQGYQWLLGSDHLLQKNEYIPARATWCSSATTRPGIPEHVALVEYCTRDAEGNVIHVIEGNNPSSVQRNSYAQQQPGAGLWRVRGVGTTMRYGNRGDKVLWLQQALHTLGYLEEKHLTGAFGQHAPRRDGLPRPA